VKAAVLAQLGFDVAGSVGAELVRLGDTYHASGDTGAAGDTWRPALSIFTDLDHPDAEQVRARLRNGRSTSARFAGR
jgi:hypothetical protein